MQNTCSAPPDRAPRPRLDQVEDRERRARAERRARLEKRAAELARKQSNVLSQAEDADPTDPFTQGLRERYNTLGVERQLVLKQITELDNDAERSPAPARDEDLGLVNLLPHLALNLDARRQSSRSGFTNSPNSTSASTTKPTKP